MHERYGKWRQLETGWNQHTWQPAIPPVWLLYHTTRRHCSLLLRTPNPTCSALVSLAGVLHIFLSPTEAFNLHVCFTSLEKGPQEFSLLCFHLASSWSTIPAVAVGTVKPNEVGTDHPAISLGL